MGRNKWTRIIGAVVLMGITSILLFCSEPSKDTETSKMKLKTAKEESHLCPKCEKHSEESETLKKKRKTEEFPPQPPLAEWLGKLPKLDGKMIDLLKQFDPERLEHLFHLMKVEPEAYIDLFKRTKEELMHLLELRKRDPERYEQVLKERTMEKEAKELAIRYRESGDKEEREKVKKEIRKQLEGLFDKREAQRETEIKRLEDELAKLKEKMKVRKANRDKIIERRQKELLGEEDDLGW
ncbi:MAG: hypothetical protein QME16_01775 [Planctomycetota bacterium]|nr:hypothetical protein [Planctomycetota bacterium]